MALYTQATQRIEVVVKGEGGAGLGGQAVGTGKKGNKKKTEEETNHNSFLEAITGSSNPKRQKQVLLTNGTHLMALTKQISRQALQYKLGGLGYQYGDQSYQQLAQRQFELLEDGAGVASSVLMGAVYGAWGGPLGIAVGITVGALSSTASLASKYGTREREFNVKVFKENNGIQYMRARAGVDLTTGRLR